MSARRPVLAANWKMNLLRADAESYCADLGARLRRAEPAVDVVVFPPAVLIDTVVRGLEGTPASVGGQDVHPSTAGAFTGNVAATQLRDAGCAWALCGHSERRRDHGEGDALVGSKARAALGHGLGAMVCLGETAEERRAGITAEVLERQLLAVVEAVAEQLAGAGPIADRFAVAYEPVWAIGTGDTATPALAQEAHSQLRALLGRELDAEAASRIRLLYGGSAKPSNVAELFAEEDIDGFLVGGASLDSSSFWAMIDACAGA